MFQNPPPVGVESFGTILPAFNGGSGFEAIAAANAPASNPPLPEAAVSVGAGVTSDVGAAESSAWVGSSVGSSVGSAVGSSVGSAFKGARVGSSTVGARVGTVISPVVVCSGGACVGSPLGTCVGCCVGAWVSSTVGGASVTSVVGSVVPAPSSAATGLTNAAMHSTARKSAMQTGTNSLISLRVMVDPQQCLSTWPGRAGKGD